MFKFYRFIRPLLFKLAPEVAHEYTLTWLKFLYRYGLLKTPKVLSKKSMRVMGINFPNPVGLAAGLDKNADYVDALSCLGFGFIEVGTVTPRPQEGNAKPRLFRLVQDKALINRMGFNNKGLAHVVNNLRTMKYCGIIGVNMGKNSDTPLENAVEDYLQVMTGVYPHASYLVINLSSPNTPGLRELQHGKYLDDLLSRLKTRQHDLEEKYHRYVPLVVKIAPDLTPEELAEIAENLLKHHIDGVIATNTSIERPPLKETELATQTGGLSGAPIKSLANQQLVGLKALLQDKIPIIGVGGIMSGEDAKEKFDKGAVLVQIYTGLIYEGPQLIEEIVNS